LNSLALSARADESPTNFETASLAPGTQWAGLKSALEVLGAWRVARKSRGACVISRSESLTGAKLTADRVSIFRATTHRGI
jgi:hypothetical protein